MAGTGRIIASIYRQGTYNYPGVTGRLNHFPGALTHLYPAPAGTTVNGLTMLTVVSLLPSGLTTPKDDNLTYYAAASIGDIQTAST